MPVYIKMYVEKCWSPRLPVHTGIGSPRESWHVCALENRTRRPHAPDSLHGGQRFGLEVAAHENCTCGAQRYGMARGRHVAGRSPHGLVRALRWLLQACQRVSAGLRGCVRRPPRRPRHHLGSTKGRQLRSGISRVGRASGRVPRDFPPRHRVADVGVRPADHRVAHRRAARRRSVVAAGKTRPKSRWRRQQSCTGLSNFSRTITTGPKSGTSPRRPRGANTHQACPAARRKRAREARREARSQGGVRRGANMRSLMADAVPIMALL